MLTCCPYQPGWPARAVASGGVVRRESARHTLASPRTGLAPAGCRELVARLRRRLVSSSIAQGPLLETLVVGSYYDPQKGQFLSVDPYIAGTIESYGYGNDDSRSGGSIAGRPLLGRGGSGAGLGHCSEGGWSSRKTGLPSSSRS